MKHTVNILNHILTFYSYSSVPLQVKNTLLLFTFLILLLVVISALSLRKIEHFEYTKILSRDNSDTLRGIAILLIIVNHMSVHLLGDQSTSNWLINWGGYGVAIFLILSGFGIHESYKKKGIEKNWMLRRYIRIWIPYVIVTIIWLIFDPILLNIHHNILYTIPVVLGLVINGGWQSIDFNMWFIPFILLQYLIFYFVYRKQSLSRYLKFGLFILVASWVVLIHEFIALKFLKLNIEPWGITNTIYFPIGILISMYYETITGIISKISKKSILITTVLIIFISLAQSFLLRSNILLSVIFIFSIFYLFELLNLRSRFLYLIGTISYEIYLLHGPLMYRYDFLIFRDSPFITIPIYFALITIIALILNIISRHILNVFKKFNLSLINKQITQFKSSIFIETH